MSLNTLDRPDVEAILAELRADQTAIPSPVEEAAASADPDLPTLLAEANRLCQLPPVRGWKSLVRRPFLFLFSDLYTTNAAMVRCLNRISRLLAGEDLPEAPPLLETQARKVTLLTDLSGRVAALEAKLGTEERLP